MFYEYPFNGKYQQIGGNRLHYLDEGEGAAVVLLHGNPTWSYYYRNLIQELSSRFRVIVPDHIGSGLSDKPQGYAYTLENHISNLSVLLKRLNLTRVSLVVHDWGGAIGMGYGVRQIKDIEKIVILNTAAFRSKRIPLRIRICRWPVIGRLIVQGLNGFALPAVYMAVENRMRKSVARSYLKPYDSWRNRAGIYGFVQDIPLNSRHVSYQFLKEIEEGLENIHHSAIPLLIAWGGKDFCFNDHFYNEWKRRFPAAETYYFPDAGHYVLEDKKGVIEPIIKRFLLQERKA